MRLLFPYVLLLLIGASLASCVSNKRIVYVQDYTAKKPHDYLADTTFEAHVVDYELRTGDVVYVKSEHRILSETFSQLDETYMSDNRAVQSLPVLAGYTVDEEGRIDLPVVGKVEVAGHTIFDAQNLVQEEVSQIFPGAALKLYLLNYHVTVLGEVNRPGRYPVYNHRINVFEAMGLAGDATEFASRETVKIIRSRDGKNHLYSVDLTDQNILGSPDFYLQPNDILMVKPQKRKKFATRDIQNVFNAVSTVVGVATLYILITRE